MYLHKFHKSLYEYQAVDRFLIPCKAYKNINQTKLTNIE